MWNCDSAYRADGRSKSYKLTQGYWKLGPNWSSAIHCRWQVSRWNFTRAKADQLHLSSTNTNVINKHSRNELHKYDADGSNNHTVRIEVGEMDKLPAEPESPVILSPAKLLFMTRIKTIPDKQSICGVWAFWSTEPSLTFRFKSQTSISPGRR